MTVTLGARQTAIAQAIIAGAHVRGFGDAGAKVGLMTALQESKLRMYANSTVPESLAYPHDAVGNDYDSLNFFQQRVTWWATGSTAERVAKLMDQGYAITAFYDALNRVSGWRTLAPGVAAQKVQVSAFPDAYTKWADAADKLIAVYPPPEGTA